MEIKTIGKKFNAEGVKVFDIEVNAAMAEGWTLTKRERIDGYNLGKNAYQEPSLYAELVKLDEPEEPEKLDPVELLRAVSEFCKGVPQDDCRADNCPLAPWCGLIRDGKIPEEWPFPEKEAVQL